MGLGLYQIMNLTKLLRVWKMYKNVPIHRSKQYMLPWTLVKMKMAISNKSPEFLKMNPMRKMPIMETEVQGGL